MPELSMRKRLNVVRFYFQGLPYEEIVTRAGVAKGTVVNVINELKVGRFAQVTNLEDEVEALREVAVGLKRTNMSVSQAASGLVALQWLESLGVEPGELEQVTALYRQLASGETAAFVRAAITLEEVQDRTGKDPQELMVWLEGLEHQCEEMAPLAQEVTDLQRQRESLVREIVTLNSKTENLDFQVEEQQQHLEWLQEEVGNAERLIGELGRRFLRREGEAHELEHRFNEARKGLEEISRLGLPLARLPELAAHLTSAAQHQGVDSEHFLDWFITCLDGASSLLGLETLITAKQEQLQAKERALAAASARLDRCAAQVEELKRQRTKEEAAQRKLREAWREEVLSIGTTLKEAASHEVEELRILGTSLREEVLSKQKEFHEAAFALGRLEEAIDSYVMVRPLISLLQGKDGLAPGEVRIAATALCLGLLGYLDRSGQYSSIGFKVKALLEGLERWQV